MQFACQRRWRLVESQTKSRSEQVAAGRQRYPREGALFFSTGLTYNAENDYLTMLFGEGMSIVGRGGLGDFKKG